MNLIRPSLASSCIVLSLTLAASCTNDDAVGGSQSGGEGPGGAKGDAGGPIDGVAGDRTAVGGSPDLGGAPSGGAPSGGAPQGQGGASFDGGAGGSEQAGAGGRADEPGAAIRGNIGIDDLPDHGSVAFVLVGERYQMFKKEGAADTSIAFIGPDGTTAYGWYRDRPVSDPTNKDVAFSLDLTTGVFTDIVFEGSRASIVRGGNGSRLVGKMILMNGTPDDKTDDLRHGFIYDLETKALELVSRDGYTDIGFTSINSDGVVTGFNDFGALGFVYEGGEFFDLVNPQAYRLFPFAITTNGTIVGAWGSTEDDWFEELKGDGFVARPAAPDGYETERVPLQGYLAGYLTGLNDAGAYCGTGHKTANSYRVLLRGASLSDAPEAVPFAKGFEPFPTGLTQSGLIYGQAMAVEVEKDCAGHGVPSGDTCTCEDGYQVDPVDPKNCISNSAKCSGHGHEHEAGNCHCDAGFKNPIGDKTKCIPS
jgi:hypothetical protein